MDQLVQGTIAGYNNAKNKISSVTKETLVSVKDAANEGQKWVKANKNDILKVTEEIKTAGDHMTKAGLGLAVAGLAVGPEGAVPGLRLAQAGGYVSGIGTFGEIATETITKDYSTAAETGLIEVVAKGAGIIGNIIFIFCQVNCIAIFIFTDMLLFDEKRYRKVN